MKKLNGYMIRKTMSMLLMLSVLLNTFSVFAGGQPTLSVGSAAGTKGNAVNIKVTLSQPEGVTGMQFTVKYDKNTLSVSDEKITKGTLPSGWTFDANTMKEQGEILLACAGSIGLQGNNTVDICIINFTIKADTPYDETPVTIDSVFVGNGIQRIQVIPVSGKITVMDQTPGNSATPTKRPTPVSTSTPIPSAVTTTIPSSIPTTIPTMMPTAIPSWVPTSMPTSTVPELTPTPTAAGPVIQLPIPLSTNPGSTSAPTGALTSTPTPTPTTTLPVPSVLPTGTVDEPHEEVPGAEKWKDIKGHWAAKDILRIMDTGIVKGYPDGTLRPDSKITRAEIVTILVRALGVKVREDVKITFADKDEIPSWAVKYVDYAVRNNIIKGYENNTFCPQKNIKRSEMAVMITKAFSLSKSNEDLLHFKDNKSIPSWAKEFVAAVVNQNIIKGYQDNTFRPSKDITRAEALVMLARAMEARGLFN